MAVILLCSFLIWNMVSYIDAYDAKLDILYCTGTEPRLDILNQPMEQAHQHYSSMILVQDLILRR